VNTIRLILWRYFLGGLLGLACLSGPLFSANAEDCPSKQQKSRAKQTKKAVARRGSQDAQKCEKIEVTGSHIRYKVKPGERHRSLPLNVIVVDPKDPAYQGYSSPLDMLARIPSVTRGYRGH
jgi:hypothetical protein